MPRFAFHAAVRHINRHPRWVLRAVQFAIFAVAGVLAFILRFDFTVPAEYRAHLLAGFLRLVVPTKILIFHLFKLDHGWWRYASIRDVTRLAVANFAGSAFGCVGLLLFAPQRFPRSIYFLDFLLCFVMTAGARLAVRLTFEFFRSLPNGVGEETDSDLRRR